MSNEFQLTKKRIGMSLLGPKNVAGLDAIGQSEIIIKQLSELFPSLQWGGPTAMNIRGQQVTFISGLGGPPRFQLVVVEGQVRMIKVGNIDEAQAHSVGSAIGAVAQKAGGLLGSLL